MRAPLLLLLILAALPAAAQAPGTPAPRAAPSTPVLTMDTLTRQGFEVKAITKSSDRQAHFVVILQRAGEAKTCLMRLQRSAQGRPQSQTLCF